MIKNYGIACIALGISLTDCGASGSRAIVLSIDGKLFGQRQLSAIASRYTSFAPIGPSWDHIQFDNFRLQSFI